MGQETTCKWCGAWIHLVTVNGRPRAMQRDRQHRCLDQAIGSKFSAAAAMQEQRLYIRRDKTDVSTTPERTSSRLGLAICLLSAFAMLSLFYQLAKWIGY